MRTRYNVPANPADRPKGRWFHLWMVGVLPQARGRGVATKLTEFSCKLAASRGFHVAFAECTGSVSTAILGKVGGTSHA